MSRRRIGILRFVIDTNDGCPQIRTYREWPVHTRRRLNVARDVRRIQRRKARRTR